MKWARCRASFQDEQTRPSWYIFEILPRFIKTTKILLETFSPVDLVEKMSHATKKKGKTNLFGQGKKSLKNCMIYSHVIMFLQEDISFEASFEHRS